MTPSLQQAIKLLQLSKLELQEVLIRKLLENPLLEESPRKRNRKSGSGSTGKDADRGRSESR